MQNTALILVDIQNEYFPGGKNELPGIIDAGQQAKKVLTFFRQNSLPIFFIQHESNYPGASSFINGTQGIEINECVAPLEGEQIVIKHFPNSFRETTLQQLINSMNIKHLVVTGMMTSMCIDSTIRAAFDLGYQTTLIHDATAAPELSFQDETIPANYVQNSFLAALGSVFTKLQSVDDLIGNP